MVAKHPRPRQRRQRASPLRAKRRDGTHLHVVGASPAQHRPPVAVGANETRVVGRGDAPPDPLTATTTWNSPYVLSCFVAIDEKKLPFECNSWRCTKRPIDRRRTCRPRSRRGYRRWSTATSRCPSPAPSSSTSRTSGRRRATRPLFPRDLRQRGREHASSWPGSAATSCLSARSARPSLSSTRETPAALGAALAGGPPALEKLVSFAARVIPADGGALFGAWCIADTDPR